MKFLNTDFNLCLNSLSAWKCETGKSWTHNLISWQNNALWERKLKGRHTERVFLQIAPKRNKNNSRETRKTLLQVAVQDFESTCKLESNESVTKPGVFGMFQYVANSRNLSPWGIFASFEGLTCSRHHSVWVTSQGRSSGSPTQTSSIETWWKFGRLFQSALNFFF